MQCTWSAISSRGATTTRTSDSLPALATIPPASWRGWWKSRSTSGGGACNLKLVAERSSPDPRWLHGASPGFLTSAADARFWLAPSSPRAEDASRPLSTGRVPTVNAFVFATQTHRLRGRQRFDPRETRTSRCLSKLDDRKLSSPFVESYDQLEPTSPASGGPAWAN